MSEPLIRRRSLPDSLRYLADKLDSNTISNAERLGVALALQTIADEITTPESRCTSTGAGNNRRCELPTGHRGLHENNEFFGLKWANLPGDPVDARPARPDDEPVPGSSR